MSAENLKNNPEDCVEHAINRVGEKIVLALPLGLGKANHVANAFYNRALNDPSISLHIVTALTLEIPAVSGGVAQRFLQPIVERLYAGVPELLYAKARRENRLPANITVSEFFFNPGKLLGSAAAQQSYISSNYTHVVRDLLELGVNVLAQMIAPHPEHKTLCSLSCNTDLTLDLLEQAKNANKRICFIGEINHQLPYLGNDAQIETAAFDAILDGQENTSGTGSYRLFPVPNQPVSLTDYSIALHVSTLVKDEGTLQIGIGSLGDAIAHMIALRHQQNDLYKQLVERLTTEQMAFQQGQDQQHSVFEKGLYACSEMLVEGLLHLRQAGVLKRQVSSQNPEGQTVYCHGGFYLGSGSMYQKLRHLNEADRAGINMTQISFINQLYGDEILKRSQRKHARFINSAMMVALTGEVVSDGLKDHQIVSGVGGQYNFVAQAHELEDGRSIICLPSTRFNKAALQSNIVWEYAHTTIPRHLRDIVITEYGVAELRGKTDRDVMVSILAITDARFQDALLEKAKAAGKVEGSYQIPECFRNNLPAKIAHIFAANEVTDALPYYPLGSDFTEQEALLAVVLEGLKSQGSKGNLIELFLTGLKQGKQEKVYDAYLQRLGLLKSGNIIRWTYRKLITGALCQLIDPDRPVFPTLINKQDDYLWTDSR